MALSVILTLLLVILCAILLSEVDILVFYQPCLLLLKIRKYLHFSLLILYFLKYSPYDKMVLYG